MAPGTRFESVLDDISVTDPSATERVVLCSGKLYYDLVKERDAVDSSTALVRIEELSPFPSARLAKVLGRYINARDVVWVQEEPYNQGAYSHVRPRVERVLESLGGEQRLRYVGRKPDAVPAPGVSRIYAAQQKGVLKGAFEQGDGDLML